MDIVTAGGILLISYRQQIYIYEIDKMSDCMLLQQHHAYTMLVEFEDIVMISRLSL